jgi:rhodanese-related sulfurtransferase
MRFLTILLLLATFACQNQSVENTAANTGEADTTKSTYKYVFTDTILVSLGAVDFYSVLKAKRNMPILDLRSEAEFKNGHIWRSTNVPAGLPGFKEKIEAMSRTQEYAVYCQAGNVSMRAAEEMKKLGFKRIYHLQNGLIYWGDTGQALQLN